MAGHTARRERVPRSVENKTERFGMRKTPSSKKSLLSSYPSLPMLCNEQAARFVLAKSRRLH